MEFKIHAVEIDGKWLKFDVGSRFKAISIAEKIKVGSDIMYSLKRMHKKRSLDANAYFWTMCSKLAAVLGIPKEEIYRELIREIGDNFIIGYYDEDAVQPAIKFWQGQGLGWVTDVLGKVGDKIGVFQYYGSSHYDTTQMSRLIDLLLEECKEQGIDTLSDREKSLMLEEWKNEKM